MKRFFLFLLASASVIMAQAVEIVEVAATEGPKYLSEVEVKNYGAPYFNLVDSFDANTSYAVRQYDVYAYPVKVGSDSVKLYQTGETTYQLGVQDFEGITPAEKILFATYSKTNAKVVDNYFKMANIETLYQLGSREVYLCVVPGYKTTATGEATPYDNESARAPYNYITKYQLDPVLVQQGVVMCSDFTKDTTYSCPLGESISQTYPHFMMDSAAIGFKAYGLAVPVTFKWQYDNATAPRDPRVWKDYGSEFSATAQEMTTGFENRLSLQFTEGGYRNQYWQLLYKIEGSNDWIAGKEMGFFPEYPFEITGPIKAGSLSVEAGKKDTLWGYWGSTVAIQGTTDAPCYNIPVTSPTCKDSVLGSGLTQITQPGDWIKLSAQERTSVTLKFYDENKTTLLDTKTCNCGATAAPAEPEKDGYSFSKWVWMWASAYTWTTAQLQAASFNVDMNFYASYVEATGLEEILADMPADTKAYNILGQPVSEDYKGIVIINGKKFLVR